MGGAPLHFPRGIQSPPCALQASSSGSLALQHTTRFPFPQSTLGSTSFPFVAQILFGRHLPPAFWQISDLPGREVTTEITFSKLLWLPSNNGFKMPFSGPKFRRDHPRRPRGRSWGGRQSGASGNDGGGGGGGEKRGRGEKSSFPSFPLTPVSRLPTICPWVSEDARCRVGRNDNSSKQPYLYILGVTVRPLLKMTGREILRGVLARV